MKKTVIFTLSSIVLAFATPALASGGKVSCESTQGKWMSEDEARAKVEALGYSSRKVKVERGCYEVYATKDGTRFEIFMHPVTGEIVKTVNKS